MQYVILFLSSSKTLCTEAHVFDSRHKRMCSLFAFARLLPSDVKLYSSFSQRLNERVRFLRELNKLNAMYSWQFLFSTDSRRI